MFNKKLHGIHPIDKFKIENAKLDLIFIHGINGDAVDSWKNEENTFWPLWLDDDFDDVCVWSVGYDATPSKWLGSSMPMQDASLAILDQLHLKLKKVPLRPIIFITHSMGGLITKYILDYASSTKKYNIILENTHGVVFLAVPHDGAGGANFLSKLNVLFRVNKNIEQLSKDNPELRKLNNDFIQLVSKNNLRCLCFFEQKPVSFPKEVSIKGLTIFSLCPLKVLNIPIPFLPCISSPEVVMIVSESSASGNFTTEPAIGILEDHISISKLDSKDSQIYINIKDMIENIATNTISTPQKTQTSKLPTTNNPLFGREDELKLLDEAWEDADKYVLNLVAMGGMGKSALMNQWIENMAKDAYRGAVHVYSWSFYSQGSAEDKQISSEPFLDDALVWFGYEGKTLKGSQKVHALIELIKAHKTLLILDGLEPLQYPIGGANNGHIRDRYLLELLKELSMGMDGLVLLSSRQEVVELEGKSEANVTQHHLNVLSPESGLKLFRHYKIIGSDKELKDTVEDYHGHALSLNLLARYLCDYEDRDIKKQDQLVNLLEFPEETPKTEHAFRVMQCYENKLVDTPDLKILYMIGLFDRPTSNGAIDILRKAKKVGLFDKIIENKVWQATVKRLRKQGLLNDSNAEYPNTLDTHPLIRQYFATRFKMLYPKAWKASHLVLYHYYKDLPKKEHPDTLEEMQPLFAAVMHGCAADKHEEAFYDVYYERIYRKENYLMKKLGATASDLFVMAYFFDYSVGEPWVKPVNKLNDDAKRLLLRWAGYNLRALGRLYEASLAMHAGLQLTIEEKNWENAVNDMANISELQALRGLLVTAPDAEESALQAAHKVIEYIDKVDNKFIHMLHKAKLADVYHKLAEFSKAKNSFEEAEYKQKEYQPKYPKLYSIHGFLYCNFLLSQGKYVDVWRRATETLVWVTTKKWLLAIALNKLALGRAKMQEGLGILVECIDPTGLKYIHEGSIKSNAELWKTSKDYLDKSVEELREAQSEDHLPHPLLARAMHSRFIGATAKAIKDLKEVYDMSIRAGMQLFLCDYHLESARLAYTIKDDVLGMSAKEHTHKAKEIVESTGYKRREPELEYLRRFDEIEQTQFEMQ